MKKTKLISTVVGISTIGTLVPITTIATSCSTSNISLSEEDKTYLTSINAVVSTLDFEGVPFKAVHAVKNAGYNLFEHKFSNPKFELVLNMDSAKEFDLLYNDVLYTTNGNITDFYKNKVWKFVNTYDSKSEYAQHLNDNFKWDSNDTLEVTGSLDTGTNTNVKKIKYVGTTTMKGTYLRTYTEFLTIEPQANDTIRHYHYANNVYVTGTTNSHYVEYGRSCYLRAKDTRVSFECTQARDEPSTVDVFEPVGDKTVTIIEQHPDTHVYTKLGNATTRGTTLEVVYPTETTLVQNIDELMSAVSTSGIARLTSDIKLVSEETLWIGTVGSSKVNFILDLNGFSIDTTEVASTNPIIRVYNGTFVLIDSKGPDSKGKITGNQHIVVGSVTTDDVATFILDGGTIEFTNDGTVSLPAITIGDSSIVPVSTEHSRSEFYLYGGSIKSINTNKTRNVVNPAIKIQNKSSYMYSVYGDIYGTDGAVVTDEALKEEATQGAQIEVFGGNFSCDENHICINLRRESTFTVYGGSFTGGSTIGTVNSQLILNGGLFNATGEFVEDFYNPTTKSLIADGSVIAAYWLDDKSNVTAPRLISNNVKMYSEQGLILHIGSEQAMTSTTKSWIEFISGCYYWCGRAEKTEQWPAGMLIDSKDTYNKFQWLQKGLWTRR